MTQLIDKIYETGEWHQRFYCSYNDSLKEEAKSYKMQRLAHTVDMVARILRRKTEREIVLGEGQFRRGKWTRNAIGMLRISEETLEIDEWLCACFVDGQKAFDHIKWTKCLQMLKETGTDWCEIRLIRKFYMDQCVKVWLDQKETRSVKNGRS